VGAIIITSVAGLPVSAKDGSCVDEEASGSASGSCVGTILGSAVFGGVVDGESVGHAVCFSDSETVGSTVGVISERTGVDSSVRKTVCSTVGARFSA